MKHPILLAILSLPILGGLLFYLGWHDGEQLSEDESLTIFCAAGFQKPMTEVAKNYESERGVRLRLQFGGSGSLESQLRLAGGDLFFPADESYLDSFTREEALSSQARVTILTAGLVVAEGNPKGLRGITDLREEGVTISLAERSASIGRLSWGVLKEEGVLSGSAPNLIVTKPTVTGVVSDVAIGAVDATIAWDAVVAHFKDLQWVSVPEFERRKKVASIGVMKGAREKQALDFVRYLTGEKGKRVFREMGYRVFEEGDQKED